MFGWLFVMGLFVCRVVVCLLICLRAVLACFVCLLDLFVLFWFGLFVGFVGWLVCFLSICFGCLCG